MCVFDDIENDSSKGLKLNPSIFSTLKLCPSNKDVS